MSSDSLDGETIKELSFRDLMDTVYQKIRDNRALYLTIQYATKVDEICNIHFDIVDDQSIHDAVLFMKGFDSSAGYSYIHCVKFEHYPKVPFEGNSKIWLAGGESWPADSQDPVEEN